MQRRIRRNAECEAPYVEKLYKIPRDVLMVSLQAHVSILSTYEASEHNLMHLVYFIGIRSVGLGALPSAWLRI